MNSKEYLIDLACKIGFVLLINAIGFACMLGAYSLVKSVFSIVSIEAFAIIWLLIGAASAVYWPMKFRKDLEDEEIKEILQISLPMAPSLGPISFIACRPL